MQQPDLALLRAQLVTLGYSFRTETVLPLHPKVNKTIPRFRGKTARLTIKGDVLQTLYEKYSAQHRLSREKMPNNVGRIDRMLRTIEIHHIVPRCYMPVHDRAFTFREHLIWWQDNVNNRDNLALVPSHDHDLIHDFLDAQNPYRPRFREDLDRWHSLRQGKRRPIELIIPYRPGRLWFASHRPRRTGRIAPKYGQPTVAVRQARQLVPVAA